MGGNTIQIKIISSFDKCKKISLVLKTSVKDTIKLLFYILLTEGQMVDQLQTILADWKPKLLLNDCIHVA